MAKKKGMGRTGSKGPGTRKRHELLDVKRDVFHNFSTIMLRICEHGDTSLVYNNILESAMDITDSTVGLLGEIGPDGKVAIIALAGKVWRSGQDPTNEDLEKFKDISLTGLWSKVIKDEEAIMDNDIKPASEEDGLVDLPDGMNAITNIVAVPFKVLDRTNGVLLIANKDPGFIEEDLEAITDIASVVSLARSKLIALDTAVKNTGDGISLVDRNGVLSSVNPAMVNMFKYRASELEGRSLLGLFLDIESASPLGEAIAGAVMHGSWSGEAMALRRDGVRFPVHLSLTTIDEEMSPRTGFMALVRDITVEKEAKGRAEQYLETAQVMIIAKDIEGRVTMINRWGEETIGWARDDILGKDWFDVCIPKDSREKMRRLYDVLLKSDEKEPWAITSIDGEALYHPIEGQVSAIIDKNGHEKIIHWQHSLLRNQKGLVIGVLSSGNDITERTLAEKRLKLSEELYKSLIRASPDSIVVSDLDGNIIEVSDASLELYGTNDPNDLIGRNSLELIVPEDHAKAIRNLRRTLEGNVLRNVEYTLLRKDGSTYLASLSSSVIKDGEGRPVRFIAIVRDISERKQAEAQISEAEERYRSLFERIPVGIVRSNIRTGEIVMANDIAARSIGYRTTKDMIENVRSEDVYSPEDRKKLLEGLKRYGEVKNHHLRVNMVDGTKGWFTVNATIDPTGEYLEMTGYDITEMKETQEKLRKAEELYRNIFERAPVAIAQIDAETMRPTMANRYAVHKLGYSSLEDLMEARPLDKFVMSDPDGDLVERLFRTGVLDDLEVQIEKKDGTKGWFLTTVRFDRDNGTIDATGVDITKLKKIEADLKEAETRYRNVFENSMVGIMRTRVSDGQFVMANEVSATTMGFDSLEEFLKGKITDYYPAEARGRLIAVLKAKGELRGMIQEITKPDGTKMHLMFNASLEETGQYIDLYVMDVTRLKKTEADLKEAETRYRNVFENAPFAIMRTVTRTGKVVLANDYTAKELGFDSAEQMLDEVDIRSMYSETRRKELFALLRKDGFVRDFDVDLTRKDGTNIQALVNAKLDPTGEYLDIYAVNITDTKVTEEKLRDWEEMAKSFLDSEFVGYMRSNLKDGTIIQANITTARGMGFDSVEEMKKKVKITDIFPANARQDLIERLERYGTLSDYEIELTRADGKKVHVLLNSRIDKEKGYMDSIGINITDWKKADKMLRDTEESYKHIFEQSPIGIIRSRIKDGKLVLANRTAAQQYGYDRLEDFIENCRTTDFYKKETRDRLLGLLKRDGHFTNIEFEAKVKDGSKCVLIGSARIDPTGQYVDAAAINITEMRETESKLRQAGENYRLLLRSSTVGQARIRLEDDRILLTNKAMARMLGYGSEDKVVDGFTVKGNITDPAAWEALIEGAEATKKGEISNRTLRMKRRDGKVIEVLVSGIIYTDKGYMDLTFVDGSMFKR